MIGQTISHYKIIEKLGEGGMGVVYKARDTKLDRDVALKFLPSSLTPSKEDRRRFIREAKSAAAMNHPNICTIHNIDEYEGTPFIVMEYIEGKTLREKMERGDLTNEEALDYASKIAGALGKAHQNDIIHRDIKPENIMLDEDGRIKVMDFGLAKLKQGRDITKTGDTVGTLAYSSPEQIRGQQVDQRSDLFSLGIVLYEMLAGRKPYRGEHQAAMTYAIVNEEHNPLSTYRSDVPEQLEQFFEKALAKDPRERFENATEIAKSLENLKKTVNISIPTVRTAQAEASSCDSPRKNRSNNDTTTISFTIPNINPGKILHGRRGLLIGATAFLMLLIIAGWWYMKSPSSPIESSTIVTDRSVAVLPFSRQGEGEKSSIITSGLHNDLLTRLSNVSDLQVTSLASVEDYRNAGLSPPAIADSLGVRWIVDGRVQEAGGQVQVYAQLIDPETDVNKWADSYRRELTAEKLFAIQSEIAKEITGALQAELSEAEQRRIGGAPTQNLDAYQLYVKGRKRLAEINFSKIDPAVEALHLFQQAVEVDSSFALGWSGLADAAMYYNPSYWPDTAQAPKVSQVEAARRALKLDPELAEAHTSMGIVHLRNGNGPKAIRRLQKAIELKPSYWEAHHRIGVFYLKTGRIEKAIEHLTLAVELNPQHAKARHGLYDAYLAAGMAEKSLDEARRQHHLGLERVSAIAGEVRALKGLGRYEEARRIAQEQIQELSPEAGWGGWFRAYMVSILVSKGDTVRARKYLDKLPTAEAFPAKLGQAYASLGEIDSAFHAYEQLGEEGWRRFGPSVEFRYGIMYDLAPLKTDPRYEKLIQRANRAWGLNPDGSLPQESGSM